MNVLFLPASSLGGHPVRKNNSPSSHPAGLATLSRLASMLLGLLCLLGLLATAPGLKAQTLYVTNGASTNITSGTNPYANTYIGSAILTTDSNNSLTVANTNTLLINSSYLYVGYAGSSNSLMISNGGQVWGVLGFIGFATNSSNNSVVVTGSNSVWSNSIGISIGDSGSSNSLVISNGGQVVDIGSYVGFSSSSSNNSVVVTGAGSLWSNGTGSRHG